MSRPEKILVHGGAVAMGITGLAHAAFKHLLVNDDPFSAVNHPLQPWALALHVLAAPLLVFALGLVLREHVATAMIGGLATSLRGAGPAALGLLPALVTSGYLLQVVAGGALRGWIAWVHLGLGALFLGTYAGHVLFAATRKRGAAGAGHAGAGREQGLLPPRATRQEAVVRGRR